MEETLEKRFNGKQVIMLADNIMIIPDEAPKKGLFQDRGYSLVSPHTVASTEELKRVYKILTE
jgi:hypothetical protein